MKASQSIQSEKTSLGGWAERLCPWMVLLSEDWVADDYGARVIQSWRFRFQEKEKEYLFLLLVVGP
jgi:hypothetical protein